MPRFHQSSYKPGSNFQRNLNFKSEYRKRRFNKFANSRRRKFFRPKRAFKKKKFGAFRVSEIFPMADALNAFDYSAIDNWVFMTFNLEPAVRLIGRKRVELSRAAQSLKWLKVSFLKQANSPRLYYGAIVKQGMELRDIIDTVRNEGLQGAGKKLGRRMVYKPTSLFTRIHSEPKLEVEGSGTITDFPYKFLLVVPRAEFIAKGMGLHAVTRQIPGPLLVDAVNNPIVDSTGVQMRGAPEPGIEVGSLFPTKNGGLLSRRDMTIETPFNLDLFDMRVSVGLNRVSE